MTNAPIKVLVIDDSALMRKLIPQILEKDTSIQVVGTAMDGVRAQLRDPRYSAYDRLTRHIRGQAKEITADELRRSLDQVSMANGYANRSQ